MSKSVPSFAGCAFTVQFNTVPCPVFLHIGDWIRLKFNNYRRCQVHSSLMSVATEA